MSDEKILVVDDDKEICNLVERVLRKANYSVDVKTNPKEIDIKRLNKFDLIILDVMMPEIDGFSFCRSIRDRVDCPILFLTAKTTENDVIEGLAIGGDDYIKKPFSINELRMRVLTHLRREKREKTHYIESNGLRFDLKGVEIYFEEEKIDFTKSEYKICEYLVKNRGQVFSLEQIFIAIYGFDKESDNTAIREHIKNIRYKLSKFNIKPIETVWGVGYKWGE